MITTTELRLDDLITGELKATKEIISDTCSNGSSGLVKKKRTFYSVIVDQLSEGTRNTTEQLNYIRAFEHAVALFRAASKELRRTMDIVTLEYRLTAQRKAISSTLKSLEVEPTEAAQRTEEECSELSRRISQGIFFSNRYALYFAGQVGLALLDLAEADEITKLYSFGGAGGDFSKDRDALTADLAKVATEDLTTVLTDDSVRTDEQLKYTLQAIFTTWVKQFNWNTFKDITVQYGLEDTILRDGNYSLIAGKFKQQYDLVVVDEKFMDVRRDDVIGNEEYKKVLWESLLKLAAYNHEKRSNPRDPPHSVFTYGGPGSGKTFNGHAHIQSLADLCREKGIALWAFPHSTTDFATEFQNQSANRLATLGKDIRDFPGIVVMYIADADNIFNSRAKGQMGVEHKQVQSVYFKMFDGTMVPKNGKFMAIMDANFIDGIDEATKSRVMDVQLQLERFDNADDFAQYAKISLTKGLEGSYVLTGDEWQAVGQYLLQSDLRNREIGHVFKQLRGGIPMTEEMLDWTYEQQVEYRNAELRQRLQVDNIIAKFDTFIQTRLEMERASYEAKLQKEYDIYLQALQTEKALQTKEG